MCFQEMKSSWRSLVGGGMGIVRQCFSYHRADPSCANGTASLWGPMGLGLFHMGFYEATRIHPAFLAWPFSRLLR